LVRGNKKPGAESSARAYFASFNFRNYADLGAAVKRARHNAATTPPLRLLGQLLLSRRPCQNAGMPRVDRYDIIGMALLAFVLALWVLHFALPAPPPPDVILP
jgi:hypothetical protein